MNRWNPWHGCTKISEGCANCYVYRIDEEYDRNGSDIKKNTDFISPVKKNRRGEYKIPSGELIGTCFTSDFLLEQADEWRLDAWQMIKERSDLTFMFFTKRIDRLEKNLPQDWNGGYENVIIGCTCENQNRADYRLPIFLSAPIKHRLIICEPLLEEINLTQYLNGKIDEVSVGGESGVNARFCKFEWVLKIREQCVTAGLKFKFHQTGYRFIKDKKLYLIDRKLQQSQAQKAKIDFNA